LTQQKAIISKILTAISKVGSNLFFGKNTVLSILDRRVESQSIDEIQSEVVLQAKDKIEGVLSK